jgi:DNA internalization-related competence protein ComEC/Rec2
MMIAAIILAVLTLAADSAPEQGGGTLTVVFLDVGQGDAALVQTPGGKNILIDAGPAGPRRGADAGKRVILPFLRARGVNRLDQIIVTHPDLDHIGGLESILKSSDLKVVELLEPGVLHPSEAYEALLETALACPKLIYRQPRAGTALDWGEGVRAEVLHPSVLKEDNNDSSVVVKIAYGQISFLFAGDISAEVEKEVIRRMGWRLRATILKVAHHGSKHSSSDDFLGRVRPEAAVISCGKGNLFGHPAPETLERLRKIRAKVYRTDESGNITIVSDGEGYRVETEKH